jgi:hypothetical protein
LSGLFVYCGFAINKHLPKLVLVPPLLFLLWVLLDFWPLEIITGKDYRLYAAVAQLLLGLLVLQLNLALNKKSRLFVRSQFAGPAFNWRILSRFLLVNIPLLPLVILLLGFSTASSLIEEQSAGFMRLKPNGLYMIEKRYQKNNKTIRLTSMIHLGQREYYESLQQSLQGQQALLLAEGVSDKTGRLKGNFSYQKIADMLSLSAQERILIAGRQVAVESLDRQADRAAGTTDILPADIDLQDFDEQTIAVLNALGKYILNSDSLVEGFRNFNRWAEANATKDTNRIVMHDLVEKRNRRVLSYLPKSLQKYDTVVIPWGALHMPGIEQAVLARNFTLQEQHERLSIDFLLLPYERLWGTLNDNK